jgi:DNA (cytosine-5)-methyltransferase 1
MADSPEAIIRNLQKKGYKSKLEQAVQMWPTPTASSWGNEGSRNMLDKHVQSGNITEQDKRAMTAGNGGKLNPTWVEWLMGFPTGWTDLED